MRTVTRVGVGKISLRLVLIVLTTLNDSRFFVRSSPTSTPLVLTNSINNRFIPRDKINLQRSVDMSRKFACKEPQPRAYNLRDLMQSLDLQNPGESANQPVYMIVKRCDGHSGCCMNPNMVCTPLENSTYYEELEIEVWSLVTNETRRQWIRIEQHGKCSCEDTNFNEREKLELQKPNVTIL